MTVDATESNDLTEDYLRRLRAVQPRDLPPELDLFDEETSRNGLRLNRAAYSLKHPEQRELFANDEEAWMGQFGLTDEEKGLIRARDWIELWRRGMSIYTMIKLIGVTGTPLVEIGRQMRERGVRGGSSPAERSGAEQAAGVPPAEPDRPEAGAATSQSGGSR